MNGASVAGPGIRASLQDHVLELVLDRPDRLNAVDVAMVEALDQEIRRASTDGLARAVLLTAAGRAFCAGADIAGPHQDTSSSTDSPLLDAVNRLISTMVVSPLPIVVAVNGIAAGAGCSLALAGDVLVAASSADFVFSFAKVGLMPDGGLTATLAASIGRARALSLALTGGRISAQLAADWGIAVRVVPDDELAGTARELAVRLAAGAPAALAATKHAINLASFDLAEVLARESDGQRILRRSADFREGVAAFQQKRSPRFGLP